MSDTKKYLEIFDYLSAPEMPTAPETTVVFGRYDARLIKTMGSLLTRNLASSYVISGGIGKDSGYLADLGLPEAKWLAAAAVSKDYNIPREMIHIEPTALSGGDNARLSLKLIDNKQLGREAVTALAHATSLRRLAATLNQESGKLNPPTKTVYRAPTSYPFDATNPVDQAEAAAELVRLADWPAIGIIQPQTDLPEDLIEFARETVPETPFPPAPWQTAILRNLPQAVRSQVIKFKS